MYVVLADVEEEPLNATVQALMDEEHIPKGKYRVLGVRRYCRIQYLGMKLIGPSI